MTLRMGLLGTGYWASETHAAAIAADPDTELVGVWGRNPAKAKAVAAARGGRAYAEVDDLLADVDAVAVALPPDVQADLAVRAAEAGRHLLLDKPLALDPADADRVVAAVERAGVCSLVFFTARFAPAVQEWLRAAAGQEWHGARGAFLGSIYQPGSPYADSAWRQQKGALWDIGPHALAATLPLLGPVSRVTAAGGRGDTVHLVLGHDSGASSTLSMSLTVPPEAVASELAVYGPSGTTTMPDRGASAVEAFRVALAELRAGIAAGEPAHPCDVRFGRDVVAVLAAAQQFLDRPEAERAVAVRR